MSEEEVGFHAQEERSDCTFLKHGEGETCQDYDCVKNGSIGLHVGNEQTKNSKFRVHGVLAIVDDDQVDGTIEAKSDTVESTNQ